jgi:hypothetical protein
MRHVRLTAWLAILVASAGSAAIAQATSRRAVLQPGNMYKPHAFPISGDGDFSVRGLRWHSWGGKKAVADGTAVEEERPSHVDYTYPVRVTLSRLTYCANRGRRVYLKVSAQIQGSNPGVFGDRNAGQLWTCAGTWKLTASDSRATAATACPTSGLKPQGVTTSITARGTSCQRARTVVSEWFHKLKQVRNSPCVWADGSDQPGVCTVRVWRCRAYHTVNGQTYPVTCKSDAGRREIHFVNKV